MSHEQKKSEAPAWNDWLLPDNLNRVFIDPKAFAWRHHVRRTVQCSTFQQHDLFGPVEMALRKGDPVDPDVLWKAVDSIEPAAPSEFKLVFEMKTSIADDVEESIAQPPAAAEFLFSILGPKDHVETMLGDLSELFEIDCASRGEPRARMLYWGRTLRSIFPLVIAKLRTWGIIAAAVEIGRRKFGG